MVLSCLGFISSKKHVFSFNIYLFKKICLPCGTRRCFFSPDALCSMHLYTPNNYPRPPGCFPDNCCNKDLFCFIFMDDTIINLKEFKVRAKRQTLSVTGLIIFNKKCVPLMMYLNIITSSYIVILKREYFICCENVV